MTTNRKTTSDKVATLAGQVLNDTTSSATARSLAASALSQARAGKQTGDVCLYGATKQQVQRNVKDPGSQHLGTSQ